MGGAKEFQYGISKSFVCGAKKTCIFNLAWDVAKTGAFVRACLRDGISLEVDSASKIMYNKCNDEIIQLRGVHVLANLRPVS